MCDSGQSPGTHRCLQGIPATSQKEPGQQDNKHFVFLCRDQTSHGIGLRGFKGEQILQGIILL